MADSRLPGPTVLLVDDERMIYEVVADLLVEDGLTTKEKIFFANNGEEGLKVFRETSPEVVVSDFMMPRMNGRDMLQKIRELSSETELVLMTAYADIDTAVSAIQLGVSDLLRKPFEPKDLKNCFLKIAQKVALKKENREYRERLAQAERFSGLGVLAAGLSLQLEKPQRELTQSLAILESEVSGPQERSRALGALRQAGKDLGSLLRGLSTFHRAFQPEPEALNAEGLVQEALLATLARTKRHDVELGFSSDLPAVIADRRDATMAIVNLISNAVDAIEAKPPVGRRGKLKLSAERDGDFVAIWVEDDGEGIPPSHLPQLFQPFFSTKGTKGTGLGLTIARGGVERHGGTLRCVLSSPSGTRFEIRLPAEKG